MVWDCKGRVFLLAACLVILPIDFMITWSDRLTVSLRLLIKHTTCACAVSIALRPIWQTYPGALCSYVPFCPKAPCDKRFRGGLFRRRRCLPSGLGTTCFMCCIKLFFPDLIRLIPKNEKVVVAAAADYWTNRIRNYIGRTQTHPW